MVFEKIKKINLRNSGSTLTSVLVILLIVMGIFFAGYTYIENNVNSANISLDSKYNESYGNLTAAQTDLEDNVNEIRDSFDDIAEADNTFQVAWNGLKGLGSALKLPISFVSTSLATWTALVFPLDFLPSWVIPLIFVGVLAFIVILILKILKGEPSM